MPAPGSTMVRADGVVGEARMRGDELEVRAAHARKRQVGLQELDRGVDEEGRRAQESDGDEWIVLVEV